MKLIVKSNNVKLSKLIEINFSLLREVPYNNFIPVVDKPDEFHLIYGNGDEEAWYKWFIESVIEYAKHNGINVAGKLSKNKITFEDFLPNKE